MTLYAYGAAEHGELRDKVKNLNDRWYFVAVKGEGTSKASAITSRLYNSPHACKIGLAKMRKSQGPFQRETIHKIAG